MLRAHQTTRTPHCGSQRQCPAPIPSAPPVQPQRSHCCTVGPAARPAAPWQNIPCSISSSRCVAVRASPLNQFFGKLLGQSQGGESLAQQINNEEEASTMRRLEEGDTSGVDGSEQAFGPQVVLLIGFQQQEVTGFRELMESMGADMFKLTTASKSMMSGTLEQALTAENSKWEQPTLGTPRVIVLSGMFGGEVIETVSAYRESDLPPAVFAAAVPNNMKRELQDLVSEVTAEDKAMRRQAAEREQAMSEE